MRPGPYGIYSTPDNVAKRNQVNEWLRTEGDRYFDGVIDFDASIKDPVVPDWIALQYDALDNRPWSGEVTRVAAVRIMPG